MGQSCDFCGERLEEIALAIGNHLISCDKAPFKDMPEGILRQNAVQTYILKKRLSSR